MNDEQRDPELGWMRSQWSSVRAPAEADAAVLEAWRRNLPVPRTLRHFWFPVAAAVAAVLVAAVLISVRPAEASYRPVEQPRIIDLSQGDQP
jgi:hypothetical protein